MVWSGHVHRRSDDNNYFVIKAINTMVENRQQFSTWQMHKKLNTKNIREKIINGGRYRFRVYNRTNTAVSGEIMPELN